MFGTLAFIAAVVVAGLFLRKLIPLILARATTATPVPPGTGSLPPVDEDDTKKIHQ